uniref:Uncharacterized protein n=1 Tax=Candidatus Kentrum eta TaxID=2126337 RepID=A0A450V9J6_9GAMM|nr:MAG: hypothetical protein BECKH772A_GA0070896_100709 [Candidatus Kentron sp. H]VFJ95214.1 MAG: hypothetical protein BECKH772B_GA0070898_100739 [Candidatus Kentron sp. H]VFK01416.1 MAG: hypothetical protein BECKH772C_GA0070978_100659 [Candidatus Kentron sp. H]
MRWQGSESTAPPHGFRPGHHGGKRPARKIRYVLIECWLPLMEWGRHSTNTNPHPRDGGSYPGNSDSHPQDGSSYRHNANPHFPDASLHPWNADSQGPGAGLHSFSGSLHCTNVSHHWRDANSRAIPASLHLSDIIQQNPPETALSSAVSPENTG